MSKVPPSPFRGRKTLAPPGAVRGKAKDDRDAGAVWGATHRRQGHQPAYYPPNPGGEGETQNQRNYRHFREGYSYGYESEPAPTGEQGQHSLRRKYPRKGKTALELAALPGAPKPDRFGCVMLSVPPDLAEQIKSWALANIYPEHLAPDGFEDYLHVTLKYGLGEEYEAGGKLDRLRAALVRQGPVPCELGDVHLFDAGKDGVPLVLKMKGRELHRLHTWLTEESGVKDKYPSYTPHVTLAYLKEGCEQYYKKLKCPLAGTAFELGEAVYSNARKEKQTFQLGVKGLSWLAGDGSHLVEEPAQGRVKDTKGKQDMDMGVYWGSRDAAAGTPPVFLPPPAAAAEESAEQREDRHFLQGYHQGHSATPEGGALPPNPNAHYGRHSLRRKYLRGRKSEGGVLREDIRRHAERVGREDRAAGRPHPNTEARDYSLSRGLTDWHEGYMSGYGSAAGEQKAVDKRVADTYAEQTQGNIEGRAWREADELGLSNGDRADSEWHGMLVGSAQNHTGEPPAPPKREHTTLPPADPSAQWGGGKGRKAVPPSIKSFPRSFRTKAIQVKQDKNGRRYCIDDTTGKRAKCPQTGAPGGAGGGSGAPASAPGGPGAANRPHGVGGLGLPPTGGPGGALAVPFVPPTATHAMAQSRRLAQQRIGAIIQKINAGQSLTVQEITDLPLRLKHMTLQDFQVIQQNLSGGVTGNSRAALSSSLLAYARQKMAGGVPSAPQPVAPGAPAPAPTATTPAATPVPTAGPTPPAGPAPKQVYQIVLGPPTGIGGKVGNSDRMHLNDLADKALKSLGVSAQQALSGGMASRVYQAMAPTLDYSVGVYEVTRTLKNLWAMETTVPIPAQFANMGVSRGPNAALPSEARPWLSADEKTAAQKYTSTAYIPLNAALRQGMDPPANLQKMHDDLQAAFKKAKPFAAPVKVERGLNLDPAALQAFLSAAQASLSAGTAVKYGGYNSTSTAGVPPYFQANVVMRINARHGLDMQPFHHHPHVKELLLDNDSEFKVTSVRQVGGRWVVEYDQVVPAYAQAAPTSSPAASATVPALSPTPAPAPSPAPSPTPAPGWGARIMAGVAAVFGGAPTPAPAPTPSPTPAPAAAPLGASPGAPAPAPIPTLSPAATGGVSAATGGPTPAPTPATAKKPRRAKKPKGFVPPASPGAHGSPGGSYSAVTDSPAVQDYLTGKKSHSLHSNRGGGYEDTMLTDILKEAGRDGLPQAVDDAGLRSLVSQGWKLAFRGVSASNFSQQFRTGPLYNGSGLYGNGTYVQAVGPGYTSGGTPARALSEAKGYGSYVTRMALSPQARSVTHKKIKAAQTKYQNKLRKDLAAGTVSYNDYRKLKDLTDDLGRFAALNNYDVIIEERSGYHVILNRNMVAVVDEDI